jgi:hypothetical protein
MCVVNLSVVHELDLPINVDGIWMAIPMITVDQGVDFSAQFPSGRTVRMAFQPEALEVANQSCASLDFAP